MKKQHGNELDWAPVEEASLAGEQEAELKIEAEHDRPGDAELALEELEATFVSEEQPTELPIAVPTAGSGEFTCSSCFLVLDRAQLADTERNVCADCVLWATGRQARRWTAGRTDHRTSA